MTKIIKPEISLACFSVMLLLCFSCKSSKTSALDLGIRNRGKIQIYVRKDTLKFGDKIFLDEVRLSYMKVDFEKETIAFSNETFLEGQQKDSVDLKKLFEDNDFNYFIVTSKNEFETLRIVSKHNRKWNDFATPGRSVIPAEKYIIIENTIRFKGSKSLKFHTFDNYLTKKANGI